MSFALENQVKELTEENRRLKEVDLKKSVKLNELEGKIEELLKVETGNIRLWKQNETLRQTLYSLVKDILVFYDDEEINDKQFREVVELIARNAIAGKLDTSPMPIDTIKLDDKGKGSEYWS